MKECMKWAAAAVWFALLVIWEILTVECRKTDDLECGVDLGGQGR